MKNEGIGAVHKSAEGRELNKDENITPTQQQEHMQASGHLQEHISIRNGLQ